MEIDQFSPSWVFNSLGLENFNQESKSRLIHWYRHALAKAKTSEGDIFEFGVYKGNGVIAMALLLKSLGVKKKIYAFDSFTGFPGYHPNDDLNQFKLRNDLFSPDHVDEAERAMAIAEFRTGMQVTPSNISTSGDFSDASRQYLETRLKKFGLDNVEIIEGSFAETVPNFLRNYKGTVFSANIDCDLYVGYKDTLQPMYDLLVKDGFINLDEYYSLKFPGARIAVHEFLSDNKGANLTLLAKDTFEFERWGINKK